MNREQVIELLRKRQGSMTLKDFAASLGLSVGYINDVYCGNRCPGPSILQALGVEKVTTVDYREVKP